MPPPWVMALSLTLGCAGCSGPEAAGIANADRDIQSGILRFKTYGLHSPSHEYYERLMNQRLGVEFQPVAGCEVDDQLKRSVDGYNRRIMQEIDKRFGQGAHKAIEAEAAAAWNSKHQGVASP